jgi:hypothetical protein
MESPRLPRFRRAPAVAPLQLTDRDREIIRLVHRFRFLRSPQITALIKGSSQQAVRRLQLLYHHGYLERPRSQLDYYHQGGSHHIVYGLGNQGVLLLRQEGIAFPKVRSAEKTGSVGRIYLEHALMLSDVMVALELACRKRGNVQLLCNEELPIRDEHGRPRETLRWSVSFNNGVKLGIMPDRVFALEDPGGNRTLFFLEADRGTMPVMRSNLFQTSMHRKFLAYAETWKQDIHPTRFGFQRFRVLTVTTGPERMKSLVQACSKLKYGHGLFIFTETASFQEGDIFSLSFQTGRVGETSSLLG